MTLLSSPEKVLQTLMLGLLHDIYEDEDLSIKEIETLVQEMLDKHHLLVSDAFVDDFSNNSSAALIAI